MNRLIIIGNGFDLAHQMKTNYYDFILDYIKSSFLQAKEKGKFIDQLIEIDKHSYVEMPNIEDFNKLDNFMDFKVSTSNHFEIFTGLSSRRSFSDPQKAFSFKIKSSFIEHLFTSCYGFKWVDIET